MALLCSCADTVMVTHKDGTKETFRDVSNFKCYPDACSSGTARAVSFTIGAHCVTEIDFTEIMHVWYNPACKPGDDCSIDWYPYQREGE